MTISLFTALTDKMKWHQARQTLLAENVANADTPGFRGRDLKAFSVAEVQRDRSSLRLTPVATQPAHISVSAPAAEGFGARIENGFEVTPEGNAVTLEDEMMKAAANQLDYQAATTLYTRSLRLLRTALGRQG